MNIPRYERIWLIFGTGSLVIFLLILGSMALFMGLNPADSTKITGAPEKIDQIAPFDSPGVYQVGPNEYKAVIVSYIFGYNPNEITVPEGAKVHFQVTSRDVVHGIFIPGTNANIMAIPGHVSEYTQTFDDPGEYLFLCHEYCGAGHHLMYGRIFVEEKTA